VLSFDAFDLVPKTGEQDHPGEQQVCDQRLLMIRLPKSAFSMVLFRSISAFFNFAWNCLLRHVGFSASCS